MGFVNLNEIQLVLAWDIECVVEVEKYVDLPEAKRVLWDKVSKRYLGDNAETKTIEEKEECYRKNAVLHAEYSKIVSSSIGVVLTPDGNDPQFRAGVKASEDELEVLNWTVERFEKAYKIDPNRILVGHNIAGFDIPFFMKRLAKHKIKIPKFLFDILEDKPWTKKIFDTIRAWKFGGTEFVSLESICYMLGIESPKTGEVRGSNLYELFYSDDPDKIKKIEKYNHADVIAVLKVVYHLSGL